MRVGKEMGAQLGLPFGASAIEWSWESYDVAL